MGSIILELAAHMFSWKRFKIGWVCGSNESNMAKRMTSKLIWISKRSSMLEFPPAFILTLGAISHNLLCCF